MNRLNVGDVVQCSDKSSIHFMDGGVVFESVPGMSRVRLYMSNKIVAFHNNQLILISASKISESPTTEPTCGAYVGDSVEGLLSDQDINQREKEKENPFEHTDLGTDLTGDELMESIRSICGR